MYQQMLKNILQLSESFIRVPSTKDNPAALNAILELAIRELKGFRYEVFEKDGIPSLLFFNTETRPFKFRVLLNGHLDVVPASNGQPKAFDPFVDNGKLYGRGAYDMKVACVIELLVFKMLAKSLPYPIGLQLSTDEETGGFKSTGYQVQEGIKTDFVLLGEPTDLAINTAQKGVYLIRFNTRTSGSVHAAYLWQGHNAILEAVELVSRLLKLYPVPDGEVWETTASVSGISTHNKAHNMTPEDASTLVDIRVIPQDHVKDIHRNLIEICPSNTSFVVEAHGEAAYTSRSHPDVIRLQQSIQAVTGENAHFVRKHGSSDMRFFTRSGAGGVNFGPCGGGLHAAEEYVDIASLDTYARILVDFLLSLGMMTQK